MGDHGELCVVGQSVVRVHACFGDGVTSSEEPMADDHVDTQGQQHDPHQTPQHRHEPRVPHPAHVARTGDT